MRHANVILCLIGVIGVCTGSYGKRPCNNTDNNLISLGSRNTSIEKVNSGRHTRPAMWNVGTERPNRRRDTYPINCYLHDWPAASVQSVKEAYAWFYQLWAPLEADAQHCRRVACFGSSAVWLCADSLGYKNINSVRIADEMNDLLDGERGCLLKGDKSKVQGMKFTSESWSVVIRGGEDCSVNVPELPIFY